MSLKMMQRSIVKPAEETPRRSIWLSGLDLIYVPEFHVSFALFYPRRRHNKDQNDNEDKKGSDFFNADTLKESLSRALVPFYPLAGRLKVSSNVVENKQQQRQRIEIDCNGEGALFIEAETTQYALSDFEVDGYFPPIDLLSEMIIPRCDYAAGISCFPLLIVQLTRFNCGGVALTTSFHHQVGDGTSMAHFIVSWSRLARGFGLKLAPVLDRSPYFLPRSPLQVPFYHLEYAEDIPSLLPTGDSQLDQMAIMETTASVFKLSKNQISALKLEVASSKEVSNYELSTFEVLAGHVWRSACKARGLVHDQDVKISMPVNGRSRFGVPQGYFGNVIHHAACVAKVGDIVCKPLWYAAYEIHKALRRVKDVEYLRSVIDYVELTPNVTTKSRMPGKCPNLFINSWTGFPISEVDFGWTEPVFGGPSELRSEGRCIIIDSQNGDGSLLVAAKLFTNHMPLFQKFLYNQHTRLSLL